MAHSLPGVCGDTRKLQVTPARGHGCQAQPFIDVTLLSATDPGRGVPLPCRCHCPLPRHHSSAEVLCSSQCLHLLEDYRGCAGPDQEVEGGQQAPVEAWVAGVGSRMARGAVGWSGCCTALGSPSHFSGASQEAAPRSLLSLPSSNAKCGQFCAFLEALLQAASALAELGRGAVASEGAARGHGGL